MQSNHWQLLISTTLAMLCTLTCLSGDAIAQNSQFIQGNMMDKVPVSVSVDDVYLSQLQEISQQLQSSGMTVEQVLPTIGIITGTIRENQLNSLSQIEGVKHIEPQKHYQLSPPGSDIQ